MLRESPGALDGWAESDSADGAHEESNIFNAKADPFLSAVLDRLPGFVYSLDTNLIFTSSRGAGLARLQLKDGEVIGRRVTELWNTTNPDYEPLVCHHRALEGHIQTYRDVCFGRVLEYELRPLRKHGGQIVGLIGVAIDVTDKEAARSQEARLLAELVHARKVESLGHLVSGVAHDFNNLLTCIMGNLSLIERHSDDDPDVVRHTAEAGLAVDRAAALAKQLLSFGRKQSTAPRPLDLGALVERTHAILNRLISENIHLEICLGPDLWSVRADPNQIEQAIINLVVNARDAIGDTGRIRVLTRNLHLDEAPKDLVSDSSIAPGDYVELSVEDTGSGISEAIQKRIFQPFFTTKDVGHGTGLGLFAVSSAARQAGGAIALTSELGQGSSFRILLPALTETVAYDDLTTEGSAPAPRNLPRGSETILLVEDEPLLLELASCTLEQLGYEVLACADAAEALRTLEDHKERIDLIFTDVIMPDMNGKALVERVTSLRPGIRVLYSSGYSEAIISNQGIVDASVNYLEKPYRPSDLAAKLRSILDGQGPVASVKVPSSRTRETVRP